MVDILRTAAAALAIALALTACGHGREEGPRSEPPARDAPTSTGDEATEAAATPAPREISTDTALATDPGAGTATRESSLRVVEEGKGFLIAGRPAEAEQRFETASRIDPTNGFAWYWLGRARVELGDRGGAVGVLEKAESLLGPYPAWRDRARALIGEVRQ